MMITRHPHIDARHVRLVMMTKLASSGVRVTLAWYIDTLRILTRSADVQVAKYRFVKVLHFFVVVVVVCLFFLFLFSSSCLVLFCFNCPQLAGTDDFEP